MGEFKKSEVEELLAACKRRCCVCHKFCGVRIEVDHMHPAADGGTDEIENAIPLCFDCHAEVHHYNDRHPKGRKFSVHELRLHKENWLRVCRESPGALVDAPRFQNPGPLQSILFELRLALDIARRQGVDEMGCTFDLESLRSAIATGALLHLPESTHMAVRLAYVRMGAANNAIGPLGSIGHTGHLADAKNRAQLTLRAAQFAIQGAIEELESL